MSKGGIMKKGLLIKRINEEKEVEVKVVDINSSNSKTELHAIYDLLGVRLIDVVRYKGLSIYLDDEGLLKQDPKFTLLLTETNQKLYGNLLILGDVDDECETKSITTGDAMKFNDAFKWVDVATGRELLVW
jgi:hypothetical protein